MQILNVQMCKYADVQIDKYQCRVILLISTSTKKALSYNKMAFVLIQNRNRFLFAGDRILNVIVKNDLFFK